MKVLIGSPIPSQDSVTFEFETEQILKLVYAQNAMRMMNNEHSIKAPALLNKDRSKMLEVILANGYISLCSRLMGYIVSYDMGQIDDGKLSLELMLPEQCAAKSMLFHRKMEEILATYILAEVYGTEPDAGELTDIYRESYIAQMHQLLSPFCL